MEKLHVGVDSWIIQDGNYPDFHVGQVVKFALEFHPQMLKPVAAGSFQTTKLTGSTYRICAKVAFTAPDVWVLDFGFMAYQNQPAPSGLKAGDWIVAQIYLGIDPFFYFEKLHAIPGIPLLRYELRIRRILLETTPWRIAKDDNGQETFLRDEGSQSFRQVAETNAWEDDDGRAHYVLECQPMA